MKINIQTAKRIALAIVKDERITSSKELPLTHLFFVPEHADPHGYINSVLAWSERGLAPRFKVHYPPEQTQIVVPVLAYFDPLKRYGLTYDLEGHLRRLQLISEYQWIEAKDGQSAL